MTGLTTTAQSLSLAQARRIALAAQGFADPAHATPTMRTFDRTVARTGVLQIDSVNVLQRAHFMPLYSRMGPYDVDLLRRASAQAPRRMVEYWAHVAAYMPVDLWPYMGFRMREMGVHPWFAKFLASHRDHIDQVLVDVAELGPVTPRDLDDGRPRSRQHWGWNWSVFKDALEYLLATGQVVAAGRNAAFERIYDLPERALPSHVVQHPTPTDDESHRELIRRAARSHGVGTANDFSDYYRMRIHQTRPAIEALVEEGELIPVSVEGWRKPAWLHRDAAVPRRINAATLLSPFDPVVWERERTESLFDFHYRIEIYTPAAKRIYGYYVLPFLLGDRIVARVDLKADRAARCLLVQGAYAEPHAPSHTPEALAAELWRLAGWLGLDSIEVKPNGDLAPVLSAAVVA